MHTIATGTWKGVEEKLEMFEMWQVIAVLILALFYYRNKAVGMPFHPHASTPIGPFFIPFIGHLFVVWKNYKRIYDLSYDMYVKQGSIIM